MDPRILEIARRVLTPKQFEVVRLVSLGYGWRRIGMALNIDPKSARDRFNAAERKLRPYLDQEAGC